MCKPITKKSEQDNSQITGQQEEVLSVCFEQVIEEIFLQTRRIMLVGEINEVSSTRVCDQLQMFSLSKEPVYIYINSDGGCLSCGNAIIDQINSFPGKVYTVVRGQAYSMAAIIACFGSKGCRYITPNSSMMLHSARLQVGQESLESHTGLLEYVQREHDKIAQQLSRRVSYTKKQLLEAMQKTTWFLSDDAVKAGLVDGIWTAKLEAEPNKRMQ